MWEVAISEFHIKHREFLFEWTIPQIMLLIKARVERIDDKKEESGTMTDMMEVMGGMNG